MPKLSIIVPIYNVEKYIDECVQSVLSQSEKDVELILVDDGSTDSSGKIIDSYSLDVRVKIIHKKNAGVSEARNTGIDMASGDYIWFVDGDDYILDGALGRIFSHLDSDADIFCFGSAVIYNDEPYDENTELFRFPFTGKADKKKICELLRTSTLTRMLPFMWRNIYKAELLKGKIRFLAGLNYGEDSLFSIEAYMKACAAEFIDEYIYTYRQRENSLSKENVTVFDEKRFHDTEIFVGRRDALYEKMCAYPDEEYYVSSAKYTVENLLSFDFLPRIYSSEKQDTLKLVRILSSSKMIKNAFKKYRILSCGESPYFKAVLFCIKHGFCRAADYICKKIIYK